MALVRYAGASLLVQQACPRARALGVHAGMTLGQAQAIAPALRAVPYEPHDDHTALIQLAEQMLCFTPTIEPRRPDTLLLDITGCERLFHGEQNLARQARAALQREGFTTHAAVADTIGAAWALATACGEPLCIAPPECASAYLTPLPPAALRIDPVACARLDAVGVRTIGDLFMLPRASLASRFGDGLVQRIQQALGERFEPLTPLRRQPPPAAETAFEHPLSDRTALWRVLNRLLERVYAQVVERQRAVQALQCVLAHENAPPSVLRVGLSVATRAWPHVTELARQRLEQAPLPAGILGVRVTATHTARWRPTQIDLFEPRDPHAEEQIGRLIDHLTNRLGVHAVCRVEPVDDYQPECAFRYAPFVENKALLTEQRHTKPHRAVGAVSDRDASSEPEAQARVSFATRAESPLSWLAAQPRPTRLLTRPIPIRVIALIPDGPPTWFFWNGREHRVARAWGPERIETGWWRGSDVRRDYFRLISETGEGWWVFHEACTRRWFLHGMFA